MKNPMPNWNLIWQHEVNRRASIINGSTDSVFIKDTEGKFVVFNDELVRLFGDFVF